MAAKRRLELQVNIIIDNAQDKIIITEHINNLLKRAIELCLKQENFKINSEIGILLVDNEKIRDINSNFRNKDMPTDVLSFPIVEMVDGRLIPDAGDFDINNNILMLGDIVISLEMADQHAEEYGHSFERELAFLTTHGVFHLLGYGHEDEDEENRMLQKQEAVLEEMGLKR
jgi:probable rRNA maturation factor